MSWADIPLSDREKREWREYTTRGEGARILRGVKRERQWMAQRMIGVPRDPPPPCFTNGLRVSGLPIDATLSEIQWEFGCYGPIRLIFFPNRSTCMIYYESAADAEAAWWQESSGRLFIRGYCIRVVAI